MEGGSEATYLALVARTLAGVGLGLGQRVGQGHVLVGVGSEDGLVVWVERNDLLVDVLGRAVEVDGRAILEDRSLKEHEVVHDDAALLDFLGRAELVARRGGRC